MDTRLRLTLRQMLAAISMYALCASGIATPAESWRGPVPAPPPPKNMPAPGSPQFLAAAAAEYAYSQGRGEDQMTNPDYLAKTAALIPDYLVKSGGGQKDIDHPILHDPYVADWAQTRGRVADVVISNRYGAHLEARLYGPMLPFTDPVTGAKSSGPLPAVVFIPGFATDAVDSANNHFAEYEGSLEQLAEHGYVVLAVSPQGEGGSEFFQPPSPYCDPNGAWRQPQELGLVEQGPCAGQEPAIGPSTGQYAALYNALEPIPFAGGPAALVAQAHLDPQAALESDLAAEFDQFRPRFVFPAFDALQWLSSGANPWRSLVDGERIGIVGHSAGADAAVVAGNGDAAHRFKAAVAWDSGGLPPDTMSPTVPTLLIHTELQPYFGPYTTPPHDEYWASYRIAQRFIADHAGVMMLTLRGSNHQECGYLPYELLDPLAAGPLGNQSSKGGSVNLYYTVAWLDRWLKGASATHPRGDEATQSSDARARLLARVFDGSADRTSMGQGTYDVVSRSNAPYEIEGESVADHLTFFLRSQLAFDGETCLDWQAGC